MKNDQRCSVCGSVRELRPYGKGGSLVCFKCAFATPEAKAQTEAAFAALGDVVVSDGMSPQPLEVLLGPRNKA